MTGPTQAQPRVLEGLAALPFSPLLFLVWGVFLVGFFLPFVFAPMPLGDWRPPFRGFQGEEAVRIFLHNASLPLLLGALSVLEKHLYPFWRHGWMGKLFLLFSALQAGLSGTPHGLPQGQVYLGLVLPLGLGEYLALAVALYGRWFLGFALLLVLALYEGVVLGLL